MSSGDENAGWFSNWLTSVQNRNLTMPRSQLELLFHEILYLKEPLVDSLAFYHFGTELRWTSKNITPIEDGVMKLLHWAWAWAWTRNCLYHVNIHKNSIKNSYLLQKNDIYLLSRYIAVTHPVTYPNIMTSKRWAYLDTFKKKKKFKNQNNNHGQHKGG